MKEREFQNIATDHSAYIDFHDFMKTYRKQTSKSYYLLTIATALPTDHQLHFTENLLDSL